MDNASIGRFLIENEMSAAEEAARAAREEEEQVSRERLKELLLLPKTERIKYLDDPALLAGEREELAESLLSGLAADGFQPAPSHETRVDRLLRAWGRNRHRVWKQLTISVLVLVVGSYLGEAGLNTGRVLRATSDFQLNYTDSHGDAVPEHVQEGHDVIVVFRWSRAYARRWFDRQGYSLTPVGTN